MLLYLARGERLELERELGEIVVVETGDVLVVGACESLLSLHDFDTVGHPGRKPILRTSQVFVRKFGILLRNVNLLFGSIQGQACLEWQPSSCA